MKNKELKSKMIKVAFQGMYGSHAEEAIKNYYGSDSAIEITAYSSIKKTTQSLKDGSSDFVMLPIENSIAGFVESVYRTLVENNLNVHGEIIQNIEHCLLALHGVKVSNLKYVGSHPQALRQCKKNIDNMNLKERIFNNTASSALYIAENKTKNQSAVANKITAKIYNLNILHRHFEDFPSKNFTRFFLLSSKLNSNTMLRNVDYKNSIICRGNNKDYSINKLFRTLYSKNLRILQIQSQKSLNESWTYDFFIDFCIKSVKDLDNFFLCLEELKKNNIKIKNLGLYPV